MKGTAQQNKTSNKAAQPARNTRVQRKARPGSGNRHRADALECQADDIAGRFMRGESNLARRVTPRGPAGFRGSAGTGAALPAHVRDPIQNAFGADFSAVRIHSNDAADSAARDFSAEAFASGRDIYFRSGAYAPHTATGRRLLVHELVHVLQQTGEKKEKGLLVASARSGSGDPQFQDEGPYRDSLVGFLSLSGDPLTDLTTRHREKADTDEPLKKLAEEVKRLSGGVIPRKTSSTIGDWLIKTAADGKFRDPQNVEVTLSVPALGFLIDCLKICDTDAHYDAIIALLEADKKFEILTAFAARTTAREYLKTDRGQQWISEAFTHPLLKTLWPFVYLHTYAQFFLNPGRDIQPFYGYKELREKEFANIHGGAKDLLPSDRVILAFDQIAEFFALRQGWLDQLKTLAEEGMPEAPAVNKRYALAQRMRHHLGEQLKMKQPPFWSKMLTEMLRITDDAVKLWGDVLAADSELKNAFAEADMFTGIATFARPFSAEYDSLKPLRAILGAIDKAAVSPQAGKPAPAAGLLYLETKDSKPVIPSPTEYGQRIQALDRQLGLRSNEPGNVLLTLQTRLVDLSLQKKLQTDEAKAVGFLILALQSFTGILWKYSASTDTPPYTDARMAHRIAIAHFLVKLSQALSWADVHSIGIVVLKGEDYGSSYLIVPRPWVRIDEYDISQMMVDLAPDVPFGMLGLTPRELVLFFSGAFLREMQKLVQAEVDRVNATPDAKLQADELNKNILALPRPWRVDPPLEMEMVIHPADAATIDAITLIGNSPFSVAEINRIGKESKLGSSPPWAAKKRATGQTGSGSLQIFAWIIPDLRPLIQELKKTEPFKTRMAGVVAADEFEWLKQLLTKTGDGGKTVQEEIDEALKKYASEGQTQAQASMRAFTAINRRQAAAVLRKKLTTFANDSSSKNYAIPYHFANAVVDLAVAVVPSIDEKQQTALFLLDLAPDIAAAFGTEYKASRLQPYLLTFFNDAVAFAKEASLATQAKQSVKDYYEGFLHRNPKDPSQNESLATLAGNAPKLEIVIKAMEDAAKNLQLMFGFLSRDGQTLQSVLIGPSMDMTPMHLLNPFRDTPLINDPRIYPGERYTMEIDGDDWELVQVHRKFFYHPPMSSSAPSSASATAVLVDDKESPIPTGTLLMTFLKNGEEQKIVAGDDVTLKKLSDAIFTATLIQKLEQMAAEIEEDMNFMMDLVELIPGAGQEFAAARALAMTVGTIAAGEYNEIFKMVKEDPIGYIKQIAGNLVEKYITVEGVLTYVVLGQGGPNWANWRKPSQSARAPSTRNQPRGKLARLIAILRRLGARIANAVGWVQLRTVPVLRAVQSTIGTRPRVGWLLRRSFDVATWLSSLIPPDSTSSPESADLRRVAVLRDLAGVDPAAAAPATQPSPSTAPQATAPSETETLQKMLGPVGEGMAAAAGEFKEQLEGLLNTLKEMQLPREVFPRKLIIDIITDFVLLRLGAKVKFAYKALKAIGLIDKINTAVAAKLDGIPGDPNNLWEQYILTYFDDRFAQLKNDTVQSIYGITNTLAAETGLSFLALGPPPVVEKAAFKIERGAFPESELYRKPGRRVEPLPGVEELPESEGQTLPPSLKEKAEAHFGHDFGHVRIHADEGATTLLETMGAEGLTSGSHVYLSSEQQLDESTVLRHELTHVLQQAGERPLGVDYSPKPVTGRPGVGVRFYPERESEADSHARRQDAAKKPVRVKPAAGAQPSGLDHGTLEKVIKAFTEIESAKEFEKSAGADVPGLGTAKQFWSAFHRRLEQKDLVVFPDCFKGSALEILAYLKSSGIEHEINKIAALAQQPAPAGKGKRKAPTVLDFPRFVTLFEGALFGKVGVVAQIAAKETPSVEISKVEITYLHFGAINPTLKEGLKLWEIACTNSAGLPAVNPKANLFYEIFQWLKSLGVQPFIWELSKSPLRFSNDFVESFTKTRKTQISSKVPKKTDYLNETVQDGVGLRLGKHAGQKGEQRESHHTTQYLLVQFFRNDNSIKAWETGRTYPGLDPLPGSKREFKVSSSTALGLASLDTDSSKRGADMPAILISTDLHRRGQLHVERESLWKGAGQDPDSDANQGRSTQGYAIKAQFQRGLLKEFNVTDHDASVWNKAIAAKTPADAAQGIGNAMLGTYRWMNQLMMPALERGLMNRERGYYNAISAKEGHTTATGDLDSKYQLQSEDMRSTYGKAVAKNNEIMGAANWTLKST